MSLRHRFVRRTDDLGRTTGVRNNVSATSPANRIGHSDLKATEQLRVWNDGTRDRVLIGRMTDGKYGIRVIDSSGTLQLDETYS